jgi:hypothetical protein
MLSIHGKAIERPSAHRVSSGYPSIMGSWLRPVALHYRDLATTLFPHRL